jgi:TDG/mug DNA glycosylase family protein
MQDRKPSRAEVLAARGKTIHDVLAPGLRVVFCGINPGLYSAAVGHNFARPGNRFWPAIFAAGFTDRLLRPSEEGELIHYGCGITNIAARATATASELSDEELHDGARTLRKRIKRYQPKCVAMVGVSAYRIAFDQPKAVLGLQPKKIGGSLVWVVPNPSGLNAHYQLPAITAEFHRLREFLNSL